MQDLLSMGPPAYFVVSKGLNYSDTRVQNAISGASGSNDDSLYLQIFSAANRSTELVHCIFLQLNNAIFWRTFVRTYIAQPASSWIDDYYDWSTIEGCCKYFPENGTFCPHDKGMRKLYKSRKYIHFSRFSRTANDYIVIFHALRRYVRKVRDRSWQDVQFATDYKGFPKVHSIFPDWRAGSDMR